MATINYKEKYEKAVHAAMLAKQDTESTVTIGILETIFPELKESEDEKIRKEILEYLQQFENEELRGVNISDWISWLEKQQKPVWSEEDEKIWEEISDLLWEGYKQSGSKFSWDDIRNWINPKLKSLRPQNRWKPSDEQMKMVDEIINILSQMQLFGGRNALIDLKHDLEKLREE